MGPGNLACLYLNLVQVPIHQNRITMSLYRVYKALGRKPLDHIHRNFREIVFNSGLHGQSVMDHLVRSW